MFKVDNYGRRNVARLNDIFAVDSCDVICKAVESFSPWLPFSQMILLCSFTEFYFLGNASSFTDYIVLRSERPLSGWMWGSLYRGPPRPCAAYSPEPFCTTSDPIRTREKKIRSSHRTISMVAYALWIFTDSNRTQIERSANPLLEVCLKCLFGLWVGFENVVLFS